MQKDQRIPACLARRVSVRRERVDAHARISSKEAGGPRRGGAGDKYGGGSLEPIWRQAAFHTYALPRDLALSTPLGVVRGSLILRAMIPLQARPREIGFVAVADDKHCPVGVAPSGPVLLT